MYAGKIFLFLKNKMFEEKIGTQVINSRNVKSFEQPPIVEND